MCNIELLPYFTLISGEEHVTPACQILQNHFESLTRLSLPLNVVQTLYKERVISEVTLHQLEKVGGSLTTRQLRELHYKVLKDHNQLTVFTHVLLLSEKTAEIGASILNEYRKCSLLNELYVSCTYCL